MVVQVVLILMVLVIFQLIDAASVTGVLPLSTIPQGALERLVHVANKTARFQLTNQRVQTGDSVIQDDTGIMYIVVDDTWMSQCYYV